MSRFHTAPEKSVPHSHANFMGGRSYDLSDPIVRLRVAASSCFFGEPMYYHFDPKDSRPRKAVGVSAVVRPKANVLASLASQLESIVPPDWSGLSPSELMERAIDQALDCDPERTLVEAVRLRNEAHMRTTPQVILVRASRHPKVRGTGMLGRFAPEIIQRADEPAVGLAYHIWRFGKDASIPNSLKKAWSRRLSQFTEYQLAKYRMEGKSVKTIDVVNLVHPKSTSAIAKLVKGELSTSEQTWEAIVSAGGSNRETWERAFEVMGHMALLRNLRNLLQAGVDPEKIATRLREGARDGRQLPFRYYSAYLAVGPAAPPGILDAIEESLRDSIEGIPKFPGRTMCLADNSGSAQGNMTSAMGTMKVSTIANLTGVIAGMASDEGYLGVFGNRLEVLPIRKLSSAFDQLSLAEKSAKTIGVETENGVWIFWERAIRERERWDNVFILSDMQAGHGGLYGLSPGEYRDFGWDHYLGPIKGGRNIDVAALVSRYRREVNPDVNVFLVQVAGYQDTLVPDFYRKTYVLGGWGEGVLRFAAEMAQIVK